MSSPGTRFTDSNVFDLSRDALDELPFGVITLDRAGMVVRFNRFEETMARKDALQTIGTSFFADVAPCTNVQAFRGRFDVFAQAYDSGVERFAFSFAFRWGRQDVSITMLRKAGHHDINILVRGRSIAQHDASYVPSARPRSQAPNRRTFVGVKEFARPIVCVLEPFNDRVLRARVHRDDFADVRDIVAAAARDRTTYAVEYRAPGDGNERRIMLEHGFFNAAADGSSYATITDVTNERRIQGAAWHAAHYDALTGLPNRHLLLQRIGDAVFEADASGRIAALLFANVAGFRSFNNTFGYAAGDSIIGTVALRLGECVRDGDTVARIGGDSFAVLVTETDTVQSVAQTATRLIAACAAPMTINGLTHYVELRIGISLAPYDARDPVGLIHAAESANFAAKSAGGMQFYSEKLTVDAATNMERQNELRSALVNGEFELLYQPLIDIECNRVVAAEALVRWNHPARGLVSPLEFIPLADRTGLIVPLGEWVLRSACRQARRWADAGLDLRVCVNVSTVQFARPDFVDLVASIIADCALPAGRLELELTESVMVDGFGEMMETLTRLKALGLRLAIDDFGTGYSSLAYLKYFPVDTLKVDRSFIVDIASDEFDHAIATTILALAKHLGLECVIEGVENAEQLEILRALGCTIVQGYYFARPSLPDVLTTALTAEITGPAPRVMLSS